MLQQDWKLVEERLKQLYSTVKLRCDGYEVSFVLARIGQFKNGILVYVDGVFKGKWLMEDCEERRRFCRPINKSFHTAKEKQSLRKLPKKWRKESKALDPDLKYTYYANYWTSFRTLKSHLIKNNRDIELVKE